MKKLLLICLLGLHCVAAGAAEPPEEFHREFERHQQQGTLFHYQTAPAFQVKGWGPLFSETLASKYKGEPVDGLRLEIGIGPGYAPEVRTLVDLTFRLHNESDTAKTITTGGNCHTVHDAGFMVFDPQGKFIQSLGRIKTGGGHCFCNQKRETLAAHSTVLLNTGTISETVVGYAPQATGKYVVVGFYESPTKEKPYQRVFSQPLVLNVVEKTPD